VNCLPQRYLRALLRIPLTIFFVGLFVIALVRLAPGYGIDEREMDLRFNAESIEKLRGTPVPFGRALKSHVGRMLRGEWGTSETFGIPVDQLLAERWTTTLASVVFGLVLAWIFALLWAGFGTVYRPLDWSGSALSISLLSFPSGLLAILLFLAGAPVSAGIAIAVFPQIHRYVRQLANDALDQPCIFAAAARGVGRLALIVRHVRSLIFPQLLALIGSSAATAVSAAIPMEALCGSPGLGQLAWRAAMGRDLALLLPLVLCMTAVIQLASVASELVEAASSVEAQTS
jgi:peptide/nickel transport system permease protein